MLTLFDTVFGTDATSRPAVIPRVEAILADLNVHMGQMTSPARHECATFCHGVCKAGSPAFNRDTGVEGEPGTDHPPGVIFMCPAFFEEDADLRERIVIHEAHHGIPERPSRDYAYAGTRLITRLDTETALKNAASIEMFVIHVNHPDAAGLGPEFEDVFSQDFTPAEKDAIDPSVAWLQQWLTMSRVDVSKAFSGTARAREQRSWRNVSGDDQMEILAPRFGLTSPPAVPSARDQHSVAAIYDRVRLMARPIDAALHWTKVATGVDEWSAGPGVDVTLTQETASLPPSRLMIALLQELVHATPSISADREPEYVVLIDDFRLRRGLPGPEP